jgi:hypothetical protein
MLFFTAEIRIHKEKFYFFLIYILLKYIRILYCQISIHGSPVDVYILRLINGISFT